MSRTINTIYNEIISVKSQQSALATLDSTSTTAIWRLWAWVTATVIFTVETMHDLFRAEVNSILDAKRPGTLLWYRAISMAFQYGDGLFWSNLQYSYPSFDESKHIIDQCSVREGYEGLVIKIAKESNSELTPLTEKELNSFNAYIQKVKFAGTRASVINSNANLLRIEATVYYDPLILNADGTSICGSQRQVDLAIGAFLKNLPFDGRLKRTAIPIAILAVDGVSDVYVSLLQHKYGSNSYTDITVSHVPESGYFKIDPDYPLNAVITYTANV